ncbi:MAG TPA: ABC transporter ATP-binding protein [Rhodospirillales bacterium]|jgi:iron(III) transport system ATP-binding protein|nr:ABC transporter ATP-binding protein [Rhodospirillales bacterium]HJO69224.1 ABC transporter ATP-binding protein [Rhodospirillales bacterium]
MSELVAIEVSHAFPGTRVLESVSLTVEAGQLVCLIGPSGCGKTTLLRVIAGLDRLQRGRVLVEGKVVADADARRHTSPEKRGIGLMFQDYALFPHLNVFENVVYGVARSGERATWAREALARMGLEGYADAYPHTLSGGEQQRVALLRALAPAPKVLLLDEPFSDLDITRRAQIREETFDLLKETGVATLMVTHDPEEAMFMADHILVMAGGRIVQAGPPLKTYLEPVDAFVAALFGPVNRLEGTVAGGRVATPLGSLAADGIPDGTRVQVLIRPEALQLDPAPDGVAGDTELSVDWARLLGRTSLVRLRMRSRATGAEVLLHARVYGTFLPATGTAVSVRLDRDRAFVFPAADN